MKLGTVNATRRDNPLPRQLLVDDAVRVAHHRDEQVPHGAVLLEGRIAREGVALPHGDDEVLLEDLMRDEPRRDIAKGQDGDVEHSRIKLGQSALPDLTGRATTMLGQNLHEAAVDPGRLPIQGVQQLYQQDGGDRIGRADGEPSPRPCRMRRLLAPGGQLIADSFDLRVSASAASLSVLQQKVAAGRYFGEIDMRFEYRGRSGSSFSVLQVDFGTLAQAAFNNGWSCEKLAEQGGHYLARLILTS